MKTVYVVFWTDCASVYLVTTDIEKVHAACLLNPTLEWSQHDVED